MSDERSEAARLIYVDGLHRIIAAIDADPDRLTARDLRRALASVQRTADRKWRTDRETAALKRAIDPSEELRRQAAEADVLREREAAKILLDHISAVRMTPDGLVCERCDQILCGTRRFSVPELHEAAVGHARQASLLDGDAGEVP